MTTDPILDKVRKLLRLAQSDNANEAAAAMAAAQRLIDEHRLSVAELETKGEEPAEPMDGTGQTILEGKRIAVWKARLAILLSKANGCAIWIQRTTSVYYGGRGHAQYKIVGRVSDVAAVRYLLAYAVTELERHAANHCRGMGRTYFDNFYAGGVAGIRMQLDEAKEKFRQEVQSQGRGAALMVLDKRESEALALRDANFGRMSKGRSLGGPSNFHQGAFEAGKRTGYNMNLGARSTLSGGAGGRQLPS